METHNKLKGGLQLLGKNFENKTYNKGVTTIN